MNIKNFSIIDFKGVSNAQAELAGRNLYVTGANEACKTSVLDAIWALLTGTEVPDEPIKKGKNLSKISAEFGGYNATLEFKRKKAGDKIKRELNVWGPDGKKILDSPRALIDSLAGKSVAFSIEKFLELSNKVRVEYLADAIGLGPEYRELNNEYAEAFDYRRVKNAELKNYSARVEPFNPADCNLPVSDISQLAEQLSNARNSQSYHQQGLARRAELWKKYETTGATIERLKNELFLAEEEQKSLSNTLQIADAWLADEANAPVSPEYLATLEAAVKDIDATRARRDFAVTMQTLEAELEVTRDEVAKCETDLAIIQTKIGSLLADRLGVPELTLDVEARQLYLNGLPFESNQINKAELFRIGLKIAARILKPDGVRVVRLDASFMDYKNIAAVEAWAKEENIQLFVELVDREHGELALKISDSILPEE